LLIEHHLQVKSTISVHDSEKFSSDPPPPNGDGRRRSDEVEANLFSLESQVGLAREEAIVPPPDSRLIGSHLIGKRLLDIMGSSIGLVITSPLILAAMIAIRLEDGDAAIFSQTREGQGGTPFTIYKLRTMSVDAEQAQAELRPYSHRDGPAFKIARDPRATRVGHWLRCTYVDELPQLWNVLRGEMSLVGPRPLPWLESRACSRWHRRRLEVRPGITCYWQINKHQVHSFDDWMRLDLRYLRRLSLAEDVRLIAKTMTMPIRGRGGQ